MHAVVAMGGPRLRWARPMCVVLAHQVAVVSTYTMLAYYRVVRQAADRRLLLGWRMWATHVVLHYGPVVLWRHAAFNTVKAWHRCAVMAMHAVWFWFCVGGTRTGLERVYAKMPDVQCWGEIALASVVGVLTAGEHVYHVSYK